MYTQQYPELVSLFKDADHLDIKYVEGGVSMRQFIAGMLNYQPGWISFLYGVRWVFVRLLGMTQQGIPHSSVMKADDVPMTVGTKAAFFDVVAAQDERYWFAMASDKHLTAHLGVVVEAKPNGQHRFHVITLVHYHHWTGPVYFNVIRPFHHLVVSSMARAGIRSGGQATNTAVNPHAASSNAAAYYE